MIRLKYFTAVMVFWALMAGGVALAERMAISSSIANIRSGPGKNYEVLWKVEKYHPIQVERKAGDWYSFADYEGDKGWVHKSLVQNIPTVITIKEKCNVRSGPGTNNPVVFSVGSGIPFKIIGKKGNWRQVLHADGDKGWIYKSLLW